METHKEEWENKLSKQFEIAIFSGRFAVKNEHVNVHFGNIELFIKEFIKDLLTSQKQSIMDMCDEMKERARKEGYAVGYAQCQADNDLFMWTSDESLRPQGEDK